MDQKEEDRATLTAIMERFNKWRYPRVLEIKGRLERQETLTDQDMKFLDRVFEATQDVLPIIERNPEYHEIASKAVALIHDVTTLALENEQLKDFRKN